MANRSFLYEAKKTNGIFLMSQWAGNCVGNIDGGVGVTSIAAGNIK